MRKKGGAPRRKTKGNKTRGVGAPVIVHGGVGAGKKRTEWVECEEKEGGRLMKVISSHIGASIGEKKKK